jgi:hypothetical protein
MSGGARIRGPEAAEARAAVAGGGRPLAAVERAFLEPRFSADLSAVRLHDDARAGAAAEGVRARAYAIGAHVAFAPDAPRAGADGRRLLAHEVAHVLQQGGRPVALQREEGAPALPTPPRVIEGSLDAMLGAARPRDPAERARWTARRQARRRLRFVSNPVSTSATIPALFERGTTIYPGGTAAYVFDPAIPARLRHGLGNIAADLSGSSLPADSAATTVLDLTPVRGPRAAFRFTRLDLGGALGREFHIEQVGVARAPGLTEAERRAARRRFDRFGFRSESLSASVLDEVLIGVSQLPDADLSSLRGLRFARRARSASRRDAAGHYDQAHHRITLFDPAFRSGFVAVGAGGRPLSAAAYAVMHESGHALDLGALRRTMAAERAAQSALLAAFGTGQEGAYSIPHPSETAACARYDRLRGALTAAEPARRGATGPSGARWGRSDVTDVVQRGHRQPAFRVAARRDGAHEPSGRNFPTTYRGPESYWQEYFAECYAMHRADPALLRRMRPSVAAFMVDFDARLTRAAGGGAP